MGSINMLGAAYGVTRRQRSAEGVLHAALLAALPQSLAIRQGDFGRATVQL